MSPLRVLLCQAIFLAAFLCLCPPGFVTPGITYGEPFLGKVGDWCTKLPHQWHTENYQGANALCIPGATCHVDERERHGDGVCLCDLLSGYEETANKTCAYVGDKGPEIYPPTISDRDKTIIIVINCMVLAGILFLVAMCFFHETPKQGHNRPRTTCPAVPFCYSLLEKI